ncbi:uncharacterized protein LOC135071111 [Ostrinia nubilalis]|uniref:uncharacterized protein LOC135071111 n=1 Tax=Ostrinia nubilalis TaxID=29057 RepID=UPI00308259DF
MIIMLFLKSMPILLALVNINSAIQRDNFHHNVKRVVRDIYEYNHPPAFSVPVSIVYEEDHRQEKSIEPDVHVPKSDDQDVSDATTTETSTALSETTTSKVLKAHFSVTEEPNSGDEVTIPVAVIYDEPQHLPKPMASTESHSRNRRQRKRKLNKSNTKNNDDKSRNVQQENKTSEPTQPETSTLFPKRTKERDPIVPIVQSENYVFAYSGDYHYSYEGGDGTRASMKGQLKSFDDDKTGEAVQGSFSYIGKDGNDYSLTYTADENGYRPVGAHLPTPPPIPPAIARALKYLATKTTPAEPVTESL